MRQFLLHSARLVFVVLALWLAVPAWAAEAPVRASVTRSTTTLGEPVQLQIKVNNGQRIGTPPQVVVDGLDIRYLGPSQNAVVRFQNGSFVSERTTVFVYQVTPKKNGTFSIPPVELEVDGTKYKTETVGLTVQQNQGGGGGADDQKNFGFAEFVVGKKTAYVGEAIPVEVRLYVDSRIHWQPMALPEITGEGFTKQKIPEPQKDTAQRNGRDYDLLTFKTAITPSRAGKITIGPSDLIYQARIPRARRGGPRSLFDMFDDDVFGDPFFSQVQQVKTVAEAVEINVKSLPVAGRPADFSGAVGLFQLKADGNPKQVKAGDPVTMTMTVSGKGSFDRVTAPSLKDSNGWRTYPPSSNFKPDDELGISGAKTFEMAVIPEVKKTEMPIAQFSYFDPLKEKYITLNSQRIPLSVEGTAPAAAPLPPTVANNPPDQPPTPTPAPKKPNDIVGLRYDGPGTEQWAPLYERKEFWVAQGAAALVLCGLVGARLHRRPDAAVLALAELRREGESAYGRLKDPRLSEPEFLETAAKFAQIETAMATGKSVGAIDAAQVCAASHLDPASVEVLGQVFAARAELLYAGEGKSAADSASPRREQVLAALEQLRKGYGRS